MPDINHMTTSDVIAVAVNHQRTHRRRRQPSTHSLPLPSTIDLMYKPIVLTVLYVWYLEYYVCSYLPSL